ncbi:hypothetical protein QRT07_09895 [Vibrio parahaemolyticus]|uniref:hypothetical protein n=1 Tax=Vibrio parahaemolyticus TaxID=670 RepID=UPI00256FFF09|nr:hypothetical protein [Vibrio parahaemolyticus]WJE02888.1 hypothetical protein QRT07_09895 [Vibrio parahaemolyticus]
MFNFKRKFLICSFFVFVGFFISQKSYAYSNSDYVVHSYSSRWNDHLISNSQNLINVYGKTTEFQFFIDSYTNPTVLMYKTPDSSNFSLYQAQEPRTGLYTIQDCADLGLNILKIPSGYVYEGEYICVPDGYGIDPSNPPVEPPSGVLTPEEYDAFVCEAYHAEGLSDSVYIEASQIVPHGFLITKKASELGGPGMDLSGVDLTLEEYYQQALEYVPNLPIERFNPVYMESVGGYIYWEALAYCRMIPTFYSESDITSDEIDCRKAVFTGTTQSGSGLPHLPSKEDMCYWTDEDGDGIPDNTTREWCNGKTGENGDAIYWTDGIKEKCDLPTETTTTVTTNDGSTTTTVVETDKSYETTENSDDMTETTTTTTTVVDGDGEVIYQDGPTTTIVNVDKSTIINNEGDSGSGVDWGTVTPQGPSGIFDVYTPKYSENENGDSPLTQIFEKHVESLEDSPIQDLFQNMNPFGSGSYDFPVFVMDFTDEGWGRHQLDLTAVDFGDTNPINLIAVLRSILLLIVAYCCVKEIFN